MELKTQLLAALRMGLLLSNLRAYLHGFNPTLKKSLFEDEIAVEIAKIAKSIKECFTRAGVIADQIDTIFLTGGSTAIPAIFTACRYMAPNARVIEGDKFASVGTGLAIDAGIKFGRFSTNPVLGSASRSTHPELI